MGNQEKIDVDRQLYVNEATLELLRRRIESQVRTNFFRSIGLPIGGAGLVAIALAVFVWIPQQVQTVSQPIIKGYLNSESGQKFVQEQIQETAGKQVQLAVQKYFTEGAGQDLVRRQVATLLQTDATIRNTLQEAAQEYLSDPRTGQQLVRKELEAAAPKQVKVVVRAYMDGEKGKELVGELFKTERVQDLIINAINTKLGPVVESLEHRILENKDRLVADVQQFGAVEGREPAMIEKGSLMQLEQFLYSDEARVLKRGKVPITLTLRIRQGRRYAASAISEYIRRLRDHFGEEFTGIVILDNDWTFLAFLTREHLGSLQQALEAEDTQEGELMNLLNAEATEHSAAEARALLANGFGQSCVTPIRLDWTVAKALGDPVWLESNRTDEDHAVVGSSGRFVGITTRRRLITGIIG